MPNGENGAFHAQSSFFNNFGALLWHKFHIQIIMLWLGWCVVSSISTLVNKMLLIDFPYPMISTAGQLLFTFSLTFITTKLLNKLEVSNLLTAVKLHLGSFIKLALLNVLCIACMHTGFYFLPPAYFHTGMRY